MLNVTIYCFVAIPNKRFFYRSNMWSFQKWNFFVLIALLEFNMLYRCEDFFSFY